MKKILILLLVLFAAIGSQAQYINRDGYSTWVGRMGIGIPAATVPNTSVHLQLGDSATTKALWLPRVQDTANVVAPRQGMFVYQIKDSAIYVRQKTRWSGSGSTSFDGNRPITRDFTAVTGVNLGTITLNSTIEALLYPSQVPTSALTATYSASTATAFDLELMSAGAALSVTLNWTGGRQASTATLSTINVDGVNQSFSQPAAPGTVSGTKSTSVTRNTNTSFTNLVTTSDAKTASSSVAFTFYPKRYWGYTTTNPPVSADIVSAAGGGGELTTSKAKSTFSIVVSGSDKYIFYAYPSSYGALTSIVISGIESIGAFTSSTVSVTNASGYVQNYLIYTSNNVFASVTVNCNSVN